MIQKKHHVLLLTLKNDIASNMCNIQLVITVCENCMIPHVTNIILKLLFVNKIYKLFSTFVSYNLLYLIILLIESKP